MGWKLIFPAHFVLNTSGIIFVNRKETKLNNMKPFDLEKALSGEMVCTRDGRPVKIAGCNPDAENYHQVIGWVYEDGFISHEWNEYGQYKQFKESPDDLFMAEKPKVKREGWVNVYKSPNGQRCVSGVIHESFVVATGICINQVATVKIEWEEEAE